MCVGITKWRHETLDYKCKNFKMNLLINNFIYNDKLQFIKLIA